MAEGSEESEISQALIVEMVSGACAEELVQKSFKPVCPTKDTQTLFQSNWHTGLTGFEQPN